MKLNNGTTRSQSSCGGLPSAGANSLKDLMSDVMSMKKSDWNEILVDLIGPQKMCNMDTTVSTATDDHRRNNNSHNVISKENLADGSSHHDFYLI